MDEKEIDWEQVDKEYELSLKRNKILDEMIAEERKKPAGIEDLKRRTEMVNKFVEENGLDAVTLELDEKKGNK